MSENEQMTNNIDNRSDKEKLIEYIENYQKPDKIARNRMGCDESWYDPYYAIKETFSLEEIKEMSEKEIKNLLKLGEEISLALY